VIWLAWRRYRLVMGLTGGVLLATGIWMAFLGRALEHADTSYPCFSCGRPGFASLSNQATAIDLILLALPCLLGVIFGAPLVAGEMEQHTNRLAWTQGVSRTTWLTVKWGTLAVVLLSFVTALTLVAQWWSGHWAGIFGVGGHNSRIDPLLFPATGASPIAYTLFSFALGALLGSVLRKRAWAIVGLVGIYVVVSVVMVLFVRPSLASKEFVVFQGDLNGGGVGYVPTDAWNLGFGFRYAPGSTDATAGPSASATANRCELQHPEYSAYLTCLTAHHIQMGTFYQPSNHYWELQWRESSLLAGTAVVMLGLTVWSVRRWKA
jgi:ABC-2 family transporter protein